MMKPKRIAEVNRQCVACGTCAKVCPRQAILIYKGMYAKVDGEKCVGCGRCAKECPGGLIELIDRGE